MSLYANYLREKTSDQIIENETGFITYRKIDEKTMYILDVYVLPDFRQTGAAKAMADIVVEAAQKMGCTKLLGSIVPSNKNSTDSLKVLLAYGMSLESSALDFIVFSKGI